MNLANAASQGAYNVGNAQAGGLTNAGAARASGYVGQANAITNAMGQLGNFASQVPMNNAMMEYYRNNNPSTAARTTPTAAPSMVMPQAAPIFGQDPMVARNANMMRIG